MNSEIEIKLNKEIDILLEYKNSYTKKISLLNSYNTDNQLIDQIEIFQEQVQKIDKLLDRINRIVVEDTSDYIEKELISEYKEISSNFIKNSILIETLFLKNSEENSETIENSNEHKSSMESNDTLLIS